MVPTLVNVPSLFPTSAPVFHKLPVHKGLHLRGKSSVTTAKTKEETVVVFHGIRSDNGVVGFGSRVDLGQDLVGKRLGDMLNSSFEDIERNNA
jgi:hypothetical protein